MSLIIGLTDSERYVSHYTKIATAIGNILPSRSLRIGVFSRTNDPKESKQWEFYPSTNRPNTDLGKYNWEATQAMSLALTAELKDRARVICFCSDRSPLTGVHINDVFNRGFARPRMWAQYGENHAGVCLVFDRAELHKRIMDAFSSRCKVVAGRVSYHDRSFLPGAPDDAYRVDVDALETWGMRKYALAHLSHFHRQLFFEKMSDWRDEEEFRWVVWGRTTDDLCVDYGRSLKAIIFGENTRQDEAEEVMHLTQDEGVEWQGLKWKNCAPWYDFGNLRYNPQFRRRATEGQTQSK